MILRGCTVSVAVSPCLPTRPYTHAHFATGPRDFARRPVPVRSIVGFRRTVPHAIGADSGVLSRLRHRLVPEDRLSSVWLVLAISTVNVSF